MKKFGLALCAIGLLSLILGSVGCGCYSQATNGNGETLLRGEPETKVLIKAMEDAVAAKDQGRDKLMEALQRVVTADRKIEDLKLTEAEKNALDEKYDARKKELHKSFEE